MQNDGKTANYIGEAVILLTADHLGIETEMLDIAKQDGYDLIVQEAVYINPKYDLTDRIIKALDR